MVWQISGKFSSSLKQISIHIE